MSWLEESKWEADWWGTCQNTLGEELKQMKYAELMGLKLFHNSKSPFNIDMAGKSVLDIGGGPVSLLLKCCNVRGTVIDPCDYPDWVIQRYASADIKFINVKAEEFTTGTFVDEVWIYNVLQHVEDVNKIARNTLKVGKLIRIFEWLDNGISPGHPNNLTKEWLDELFNGDGKVVMLNEPTLKGKSYCGVFKGDNYANI